MKRLVKTNRFKKWIFILLISCAGNHTLWAQIDGNKFNHLSNIAHKKDGHFLGRAGGGVRTTDQNTRFMKSYEIVFDLWGLFGEPCYDYRFKWEADSYSLPLGYYQKRPGEGTNTSNVSHITHSLTDYPDLLKRAQRLRPIYTNGTLTVNLRIYFYGATKLGEFLHDAEIDLPTSAGKWNSFSMPASKDWINTFIPYGNVSVRDDKTGNHLSLSNLYDSRNKEGYATAMKAIFRQTTRIEVEVIGIKNINWEESEIRDIEKEFERRMFAKEEEKKAIAEAAKNPEKTQQYLDELLGSTPGNGSADNNAIAEAASDPEKTQQYLDELLGSTSKSGSSGASGSTGKNDALKKILSTDNVQEDRAARLIERADVLFDQIGSVNERANSGETLYQQASNASTNAKARAREALNLYQQALSASPNSSYIRSQILAVNKIIKWVMPPSIDKEPAKPVEKKEPAQLWVEINGVKWAKDNIGKDGKFTSLNYSGSKNEFEWDNGKTSRDNVRSGQKWKKENNPCPEGWHVPTKREFESLLNEDFKLVADGTWIGPNAKNATSSNPGKAISFYRGGYLSDEITSSRPYLFICGAERDQIKPWIADNSDWSGYVRCVKD